MNDIATISQNFSLHDFTKVYEFIADDITWNNIGGEQIVGRAAVIKACDAALDYFSTVESNVMEVEALTGPNFVSVSTVTSYKNPGKTSTVASCDIYKFSNAKISSIVSYNIEI